MRPAYIVPFYEAGLHGAVLRGRPTWCCSTRPAYMVLFYETGLHCPVLRGRPTLSALWLRQLGQPFFDEAALGLLLRESQRARVRGAGIGGAAEAPAEFG